MSLLRLWVGSCSALFTSNVLFFEVADLSEHFSFPGGIECFKKNCWVEISWTGLSWYNIGFVTSNQPGKCGATIYKAILTKLYYRVAELLKLIFWSCWLSEHLLLLLVFYFREKDSSPLFFILLQWGWMYWPEICIGHVWHWCCINTERFMVTFQTQLAAS